MADTEADIQRYVAVSLETQAECVANYAAFAAKADQMHVCGACGLRDPQDNYKEIDLAATSDESYLHVGTEAYQRLTSSAPLDLLRRYLFIVFKINLLHKNFA